MLNKLKKNNEGFTIIEVMIVLAIAGLILLIVFLAVPALQRSSRNTQRKTDVGRIGGGATTVLSNDNGTFPTSANYQTQLQTELGGAGANMSYYAVNNVSTQVIASGTVSNPNDISKVIVVGNAKCDTSTPGQATYQARQIAVLYTTESGSGKAALCVDQ